MNTIKLNNLTLEVEAYNKNTYFSDESINSSGSCQVITNDITALNTLAQETITSIQIYHNETLIYDLQDIDCTITSISEYLSTEKMNINVSFTFNI